jgi:hypothetical protein
MDKSFTAALTLAAAGTTYAGLSMSYQDVGYMWLTMIFLGGFFTSLLLVHILKAE